MWAPGTPPASTTPMLHRRIALSIVATSALLAAACVTGCAGTSAEDTAQGAGAVSDLPEAPPQFVLFAFDGSLNLDFWKESRKWAAEDNVKLAYFMSGVYFLADTQKSLYTAPHGIGRSKSAIGWGGPESNIPLRYEQVQAALAEHHEMG